MASLSRHCLFGAIIILWSALFSGCSSTKHVPAGQYLLDDVKISITDNNEIESADLVNYLRQTPNHEVLGFLKLQLATYNMSGSDSTKWFNKWIRKIGQAPVIYDPELAEASSIQLRQALVNRGYMDASVVIDTIADSKKKKIEVDYQVTVGQPHYIATTAYTIPDKDIERLILDNNVLQVRPGDLLDRGRLEEERIRITELLRNNGYYYFNKDYITFDVDTAANAKDVDLTMSLRPPYRSIGNDSVAPTRHNVYRIRNIVVITDFTPGDDISAIEERNSAIQYHDLRILYGPDRYLRPAVIYNACYLHTGELYQTRAVDATYEALGRLGILRYVNIDMRPVTGDDGTPMLDAYILLTRGKKQQVSMELEGTNSEGDLGFGLGLTYRNRNIAHGSELFTAKLRTSYESLSGDFTDLINDRYMEYAAEVGITFPNFKAPFLSSRFKRRVKATTEFAVSFNYQERPEYTRIIAGAGWKYRWNNRANTRRYRLDLIDVNYVYLPKSTIDFINQIAPDNPLLRYSYEDHFIMRMGYNYYRTNKRQVTATGVKRNHIQPSVYTLRTNIESAGNILYALSSLIHQRKDNGAYKLFDIQYAQYVKGEVDYTYTVHFDTRNSMSFHAGTGIGVPYGNSKILPFEKRFYAGGANGVRGWGVRTLGPGSYDSKNSVTGFINQCGDIRLDLSMEYRAKLFWVLEGALFIDGGNIWTIRNYENQPGGVFRFNKFYQQIAAAYGAGIRFDFTYFLLRLDLGVKAYNPAQNQERWPLMHPRWGRDTTLHFSVGYPF